MTQEWMEKKAVEYKERALKAKDALFAKIKCHSEIPESCKEKLQNILVGGDSYYITTFLSEEFRSTLYQGLRDNGCKDLFMYGKIFDEFDVQVYVNIVLAIANLSRYLDSEPVEFDGDIIITDPCYIMKHQDESSKPKWEDYMKLDDYSGMTKKELEAVGFFEDHERLAEADRQWRDANPDDWDICEGGYNMTTLGFTKSMVRDTLYGDWGCTTYNVETQESIGEFCADSGQVAVFQLSEVLAYNPQYNDHVEKPWCVTLIKNFKGNVRFVVRERTGVYKEDTKWWKAGDSWTEYNVHVVGEGIDKIAGTKICFETSQTSL